MRLFDLYIENLEIPFRVPFEHASATRAMTEAVLVTAETEDKLQGIGEGCPRRYVTGETLETAYDFFKVHRPDLLNIGTLDDLKSWVEINRIEIDKNPAAFCAVELSLLAVLAKQLEQSIDTLLSLPDLSGEFRYTGVIGARNPKNFQTQLQQYLRLGFTDFKVKVFGDEKKDRANILAVRRCGHDNVRVRLDANNLWSDWREAATYIKTLDYPFFGLEEPLGVRDFGGCKTLFEELEIPIILDESFTKQRDFDHIHTNPESWIINIRISKMGGILRSLAVAEESKKQGIPIIVGAQVGETSILTRAALTIANNFRSILLAQEGAFGTYLLERDVIDPPIIFGKGGILTAEQI